MRIGIIGGAARLEKENRELSVEETVFYTVKQALESCGLEREQIDTVIQCADDVLDGISIQHVYQVEAAGSLLKDESKVERDGAWGAMYAMAKLLTGKFQTAMVVAYSKCSQIGYSPFTGMMADPFFLRPVGLDGDSAAALQARFYMERSGATEETFAELAARNRKNGVRNPRTIPEEAVEMQASEILSSEPLAEPVREWSRARTGDGCVVLFLASESFIRENGKNASFIRSAGFAGDAYYPTFRRLDSLASVGAALQQAEKRGNVSSSDVDFAELHECYAHQELMLYEALGWCERGSEYFREANTDFQGSRPVNVSGGTMCSHVPYATGLMRLLEGHLQITGQAGPVQLPRADLALVHAQAGLAMQSNIVFFLEGDR